jgi:hypothetical protein
MYRLVLVHHNSIHVSGRTTNPIHLYLANVRFGEDGKFSRPIPVAQSPVVQPYRNWRHNYGAPLNGHS